MSHANEQRWETVARQTTNLANSVLDAVANAEERYQRLTAQRTHAGGTDQAFADVLFQESPATEEHVSMVTDLMATLAAAHDLHSALTSTAIDAEDRISKLRLMAD